MRKKTVCQCAFARSLAEPNCRLKMALPGDDIVIGKTSPIPDDGSGMPQRFSKKVRR